MPEEEMTFMDAMDVIGDEDEVELEDFLENEFATQEESTTDQDKEVVDGRLTAEPGIDYDSLSDVEKEMARIIRDVDVAAWDRGEGYRTKFPLLNEKLNGIQPGLAFVGGQSNTGKSGFLLEVAYSATTESNVYSLYFSLDDSTRDILPRIVASRQRVPINAVRVPESYREYPSVLERRKKGIEELYDCVDRFKMLGQNFGKSIEHVERTIRSHYDYVRDETEKDGIFVQIDSFHDLMSDEIEFRTDKNKYEYTATKLKELAEELDIPIWCTAETRKLNNIRRPVKEDMKESNKVEYKANLILMVYNEVGIEGENASIFFRDPDRPGKQPIFEVHFDKNKLSSFKGRLYYEFITDRALYTECDEEDMERYNNLIYSG